MGNRNSQPTVVSDFVTWFAPTTASEQLTIPLNRNTIWRAPLDADVLAKAGQNLKTAVKRAQLTGHPIRSVYLDLHVAPCPAMKEYGAVVPVEPLINAHLVRYLVPALMELAQEAKSPLVHVGIPLYGMGPDPADFFITALGEPTSLASMTLMHITEEALFTRIIQAITAHNRQHAPIMELRAVFEMDTLSPACARAVAELIATDTLVSLQLSKNKEWRSDIYPTGLNDDFVKVLSQAMARVAKLQRIDLSNNHITDRGCRYLAKALLHNPLLNPTTVNLSKNLIDSAAVKLLQQLVKGPRNNMLRYVDFSRNMLSPRSFVRIMNVAEDTNTLEYLGLNYHDFNLGAYRLKHGTVARTNHRREEESVGRFPLPELVVEMSGNKQRAQFGYWLALPAWFLCGICCLMQGPFEGKELNLTNIVQGRCTRKNRGGWLGMIGIALLGVYVLGFSLLFPFVLIHAGPLPMNITAALCLTGFLVPLFAWLILILVVTWTDPSGQWTTIDNPMFTARTWPPIYFAKNLVAVGLLVVDCAQLVSLSFIEKKSKSHMIDPSGNMNIIFGSFRLDFGVSYFEVSFWIVVAIAFIWWLIAVYIIASVAVREPKNAVNIPNSAALVPLLSNALFLLVVSTLLKALSCTYTTDPTTGELVGTLDSTCSQLANSSINNCGPNVTVCWKGMHPWLAFTAIVCLVWYLITAPTVGTFFSEDHTGQTDIQFTEAFTLLERLTKLVMSISTIFFSQSLWATPVIVLISEVLLLFAMVKLRPCQHIGWVNNLRIGMYVGAIWAAICSIAAKAIDNAEDPTAFRMFYWGLAAIAVLTIVAMMHAKFNAAEARMQWERLGESSIADVSSYATVEFDQLQPNGHGHGADANGAGGALLGVQRRGGWDDEKEARLLELDPWADEAAGVGGRGSVIGRPSRDSVFAPRDSVFLPMRTPRPSGPPPAQALALVPGRVSLALGANANADEKRPPPPAGAPPPQARVSVDGKAPVVDDAGAAGAVQAGPGPGQVAVNLDGGGVRPRKKKAKRTLLNQSPTWHPKSGKKGKTSRGHTLRRLQMMMQRI